MQADVRGVVQSLDYRTFLTSLACSIRSEMLRLLQRCELLITKSVFKIIVFLYHKYDIIV